MGIFYIRYNIKNDFTSLNGRDVALDSLDSSIKTSTITSAIYVGVGKVGTDTISISFSQQIDSEGNILPEKLSTNDRGTLDGIITLHKGVPQIVKDLSAFSSIFDDIPNVRMGSGITNRNQQIMTWRLPNGSSVQMYINPQNFTVTESKQITQTRTKGGFVVQYWGDNLTKIKLSGTTGSSGIKGIQVLRDIYRAENHAFELVAATQLEELINIATDNISVTDHDISQAVFNTAQIIRERTFILRPTLASLALSVSLFYQGIQYRGFFTEFSMVESTAPLGLFNYDISFMVTETRGSRKNFMPWHKEPLADDLVGQVVSGVINTVGNALRSLAGLPRQSQNPEQYHPESAPMSFGGSSTII